MKSSQWYRTNYGIIIACGVLAVVFIKAHVDLIDPSAITENIQQEVRKEAENNGEPWTDEHGYHHNV